MKTSFRFVFIIILLLILGFFVGNFFVSKKVKTRLEKEENLSYSSSSVNTFTGNLNLQNLNFEDGGKIINIKTIDINIDILHYLFNSEFIVENLKAEDLDITINSSSEQKSTKNNKLDIVSIEKINLKNANITFKNKDTVVFELSKLNLYAEDMNWPLDENYKWLTNETLSISAHELNYAMDALHDLTSEKVEFSKKSLLFKNFSIEPKFTKSEYVNQIQTEKDLIHLKSKSLTILNLGLETKDSLLYANSHKIELDSTVVDIYRDKTIADDSSYKALYSQALRELDFRLAIDSLMISELDITYQELLFKDRKAGEIKFNSIQAQVLNIHNNLKAENAEISLEAKAQFSRGSEIVFNYNFVPNHEKFFVSTTLKDVEDKSVNTFFAPAMRMEMDGKINEIRTSIYGNNSEMKGDFSIAYDQLKLNILKKNGSKNNFASLISNALIKNKDVDQTYELNQIRRNTSKSFWNYIWTFHLKGLRQALL